MRVYRITKNDVLNNPQTDQDLYHDPEALSPTLFSDNYDISRKESHPTLTFFYEKLIWTPRIGPDITGFM